MTTVSDTRPTTDRGPWQRARAALLGSLWMLTTAAGLALLWSYAREPGNPGLPPARWPEGVGFKRSSGTPTLVSFVHPRCPCSRASLRELDRLMTLCQGELSAFVLFYKPRGEGDDWATTDLFALASSIPGVESRIDEDGQETQQFGAFVSGQVLVYDLDGTLAYEGGITSSRGHSGDSLGHKAIVDFVHGRSGPGMEFPVYGCSILDPCCGEE